MVDGAEVGMSIESGKRVWGAYRRDDPEHKPMTIGGYDVTEITSDSAKIGICAIATREEVGKLWNAMVAADPKLQCNQRTIPKPGQFIRIMDTKSYKDLCGQCGEVISVSGSEPGPHLFEVKFSGKSGGVFNDGIFAFFTDTTTWEVISEMEINREKVIKDKISVVAEDFKNVEAYAIYTAIMTLAAEVAALNDFLRLKGF